MYIRFALVLATLAGCSSSAMLGADGGGGSNGDDMPPIDAPIDGSTVLVPPAQGFQIASPTIDLDPGTDLTYCYYFRTSNKTDLAIKKWESRLSIGVQHMVVYLTKSQLGTPGTLSTSGCDYMTTGVGPLWMYSSQSPIDALALPADDGTGTPVGLPVPASQLGYLQMHMVNTTSDVIHAHVEVNALAYDDGVQITPAGPFVTYSTLIDLGSGSANAPTSGMFGGNCTVSPGAKFYAMTTHTNRQGVHTVVQDGAKVVFDGGTDWANPGMKTWDTGSFYSFTSGKLSYQCSYSNPNNYRITSGDVVAKDEVCRAIGYFFPSPGGAGSFCVNSLVAN